MNNEISIKKRFLTHNIVKLIKQMHFAVMCTEKQALCT